MTDYTTKHTIEQLEFLRMCRACVEDAKRDGRVRFVNRRGSGFIISGDGGNYLFKAFPGGRKILSLRGSELMGYRGTHNAA